MAEAGITLAENGNYVLPPILVQYRGGSSQSFRIEVGQPITPGASGSSLTTVVQMLRNNNTNTPADRASNITGNASGADSNTAPPDSVSRAAPAAAAAGPQTQQNPVTESPSTGIRGLDYPAFDVSNNGIYSDESQPTSRILAPLQRIFDRMSGLGDSVTPASSSTSAPPSAGPETTGSPTAVQPPSVDGGRNTAPSPAASEPSTPAPTDSRNIILTVNYVYGGASNENNSGSLLLYVPSIDETNEENVSLLVRLATEIALRTIATTLRKSAGVSKEVFEKLEVKKVKDLKENELECPICYDSYIDKVEPNAKKRKLSQSDRQNATDGDGDVENMPKRAKSNSGDIVSTPIDGTPEGETSDSRVEDVKSEDKYGHYPVVLKCGHIFGASCLSEWFKTNSSCPLCREKLPNVMETENGESRYITITLPDLARVIGSSRPFIENFNNRQMTFNLSDENTADATDIVTENEETLDRNNIFLPGNGTELLDRLATWRRNRTHIHTPGEHAPSAEDTNSSDSTPANPALSNNRQSLLHFIRDVISSLSPRTGDNGNNSTGTGTGTATNSRPANRIGRRITHNRVQFPGMFPPLGVESRRTANGVETREISMFNNHTNDRRAASNIRASQEAHPALTEDSNNNTTATGPGNSTDATDETHNSPDPSGRLP